MKPKPSRVVKIHRRLCEQAKCPHLATLDYSDPCTGCPEGHFGPFMRAGCAGAGPFVASAGSPLPDRKSILRPGDLFGIIIFNLTGQRTANCGICRSRKGEMNRWGWLGCLKPKNRRVIIGWLCEEAAKRGHPIDGNQVWALFKAGFRELRQKKTAA